MEHTIIAYLERRTPMELLGFLNLCMLQNQRHQYAQIVPQIFELLQRHGIPVPDQISASWEAFLTAPH